MNDETYSRWADVIIVWTAFYAFIFIVVVPVVTDLIEWIIVKVGQIRWDRANRRWVAARKAAREELEARMTAEGWWDNYAIQDAMDKAGQEAAPGHHPIHGPFRPSMRGRRS